MKSVIFLTLLSVFLTGCGKGETPRYEGLTLEVWGKRLASKNPEVRKDALEVIISIGKEAYQLEEQVRRVAREESYPDVQMLAIEALEAMGANTVEFQEVVSQYRDIMEEELPDQEPSYEEEMFEEELDSFEVAPELLENISGDDDLLYLRELSEGKFDSLSPEERKIREPVMVPTEPDEYREWSRQHASEETETILNQLQNITILIEMLRSVNSLDRQFAAAKLAQQEGSDPYVIEALEAARSDPDSLVRRAVEAALRRWGEK